MEWLVPVLAVLAIVLVVFAIRRSFRSDDAFYGDSTTVAGGGVSASDEPGVGPSDTDQGVDGGRNDHGTGGG